MFDVKLFAEWSVDDDDIRLIRIMFSENPGFTEDYRRLTKMTANVFANPQWNVNQMMDLLWASKLIVFYPGL